MTDDLFGYSAPAPTTSRTMGGHQSARAGTHTWLTPLPLVRAVGPFDLDPCGVRGHPTADRVICLPQDGLSADWGRGRVWCNPPYGHYAAAWLRRMAQHGHGTALIFARTETEAFFAHVWRAATALLFLEGRINFHWDFGGVSGDPTGCRHVWAKMEPDKPKSGMACRVCGMAEANSGAPSVLVAYGMRDADVLAGQPLPGAFVPLLVPRSWLVGAMPTEPSWAALVRKALAGRGPVALADLYRLVADHPKAARNPNWRAKVRQVLQLGAGQRVDRGLWASA